ncbi:hypothetical protein BHM03_00039135 [Ensete ventricosum]|nr:hypothetical protein BHM03_00039135 [Ensete ventricosum]
MPEPPSGTSEWIRGAARVQKWALPVSLLVGMTAISGAFVAGNDAVTFCILFSDVQLNHRILATSTLASVGGLWYAARKVNMHPAVRSLIGSTLGMAAVQVTLASVCISPHITKFYYTKKCYQNECLQVTLGITTLLTYVPVSLASAHQAGALTLLTLLIILTHTLRRPSPALLRPLASFPKTKS